MRFELTPEQDALRSTVRSILEPVGTPATLVARADGDSRAEDKAARYLGGDLELVGLSLPESFGGSGGSLLDLAVVLREMGRVLYTGSFLPSYLAADALAGQDGTDPQVIQDLVSGRRTGAVAGLGWSGPTLVARREGPDWLLDGTADLVPGGAAADVVIVHAESADGVVSLAPDLTATGRTALDHLDTTRRIGRLAFRSTPARLVRPDAQDLRTRQRNIATFAVAAELVGAGRRCLELMVEHASIRKQFGRAIGGFQAVKHRCVDSALLVEACESALLFAAWDLTQDSHDPAPVHRLKASCSDAGYTVAKNLIQVLGGTGYTWEHPAHLYLKRALSSRHLYGTPAEHREATAVRLLGRRSG